jgi:Domain of unknown function (DUF4407)
MRMFGKLRKLVLALSGAHEEVLELVPSERARFESLGWAILITSCMAVISMWFALSSALGINGILAIPVALFWGLVIMGIDRWLITSMPIEGGRKFAMAVPRVLLAILLGTLISTPLVLRIFQSEINAQMATMQQANYNTFLQQQQQSQVNKQVTTYDDELQQLNTVINSHGAQTGNNAADPELVAYNDQLSQLESQLSHWTTLRTQYYNEYTCQLYGGADCPKKGAGPAYALSHQNYVNASNEVTSYQTQISHVQSEIQQRDQFLSSTSASSQAQRYQEALTQRPIVQQEYSTAVQRRNQLQASYYAQEQAAHGILMRLEALSQLSSGNLTVSVARILLFLLFLVIECLPVTVKLLQRPGQYEAAMQRARAAERRDFEKFFGTRSRFASGGLAAGGRPAVLQLRPEAEGQLDPAVWHRTRMLPMGQDLPEDERSTEQFQDPGYAPAGTGDYGPPPPPETSRQPGRWRGPDAWRSEWGEPEPEARVPEPRLGPANHDQPQVVPARYDPWVAPTVADYQQAGEAAPVSSYRPESGSEGTGFYPHEEEAGYGTVAEQEDDAASARYESDGIGIPLEWEDD